MIVQLLGLVDLFAGVLLFLLRFDLLSTLGVVVGIYLILKGVVFLSNVVSLMDLLAGIVMILASQGYFFIFTWIFVLWLLQKGFFSLFAS